MRTTKATGLLALAALGIALQGCAFTKSTLSVAPSAELKVAGPLGDVAPVRFSPPQLEDNRQDRARIGWKKNGFGANTADITTAEPVDQIVEKSVAKALTDARHMVTDGGDVQVVGQVDRFWFETDVNFWTVTFIGEVRCTLEFIDARTRQSLYKHTYTGSHSESKAGGLDKTWAAVMSKATDKLIEDIVLDENLAAALKSRGAAGGSAVR
jgi:uncharacterized lipoprotein YajG